MAGLIAIVGRPNVGKSTLYNRLIEQRDAIMDNESGVTRDRHYGNGEWNGREFSVVDTGGYVTGSEDKFEAAIRNQVKIAIEEADIVLFMVDVHTGLHEYDKEFAKVVRQSAKPVLIVANKADTHERSLSATEFYELGFEEIFPVAATSGSGTGDLLDRVIELMPEDRPENLEGLPRICIAGRPNVGKSSLVNLLLGTERSIVTDEAGTTRDAIHSRYSAFGMDFLLTDTAGIRKKAKVHEDIEFYSVLRALKSLENSDIVILMVDATRGFEAQDLNILTLANKRRKGMLIFVNKWDLVEKDFKTAESFKKEIKERLGTMSYVPVYFVSVLTKQRVLKAMEKAVSIYQNKSAKISTSRLNDALLPEIQHYPPPMTRGRKVSIKYITMVPAKTPTFVFFCNHPTDIKQSYRRFLENKIREKFDFEGITINLAFRKK